MLKISNIDELRDGYNIGSLPDVEIESILKQRVDLSCIWCIKIYPLMPPVHKLVINPFANEEAKERFFFIFLNIVGSE